MKLVGKTKERFISKIENYGVEGKCWNWTGGLDNKGYGRFYNVGSSFSAHRISYEHHRDRRKKPLVDDQACEHSCWNNKCVNPAHLHPGPTQADRDLERLHDADDRQAKLTLMAEILGEARFKDFKTFSTSLQDAILEDHVQKNILDGWEKKKKVKKKRGRKVKMSAMDWINKL